MAPSVRRPASRGRSLEVWLAVIAPLAAVLFALYLLAPALPPGPSKAIAAQGPGDFAMAPVEAAPARREPALIDHHFRGCDEARAIGMTDIPVGHPSYRSFMDGDGDGLACEPYRGR